MYIYIYKYYTLYKPKPQTPHCIPVVYSICLQKGIIEACAQARMQTLGIQLFEHTCQLTGGFPRGLLSHITR